MLSLKERFALLRSEKPEITQADIARATGAKPPSVNAWFTGDTKSMKIDTAQAAAALYGVNALWLATGKGAVRGNMVVAQMNYLRELGTEPAVVELGNFRGKSKPDEFVIPEFNTGGAMGNGLLLRDQPGVIRGWSVNQEWVQKNVKSHSGAQNLCIVTGFGDSMKGMFNPGDPLLVDRGVTSVEYDAVYFFRVEDEGFIKRLQRIPGEGLRVLSENKKYESWTIKAGMDFEVFGRVVKAWQGEDF